MKLNNCLSSTCNIDILFYLIIIPLQKESPFLSQIISANYLTTIKFLEIFVAKITSR